MEEAVKAAETLLSETKEEVQKCAEEVVKKVTDEVMEEVNTEVNKGTENTEVKETELDQGTKSHIGRIVARQIKEKTKPLEEMLERIENSLKTVTERKEVVVDDPEPELPENPTADEVKLYVQQREERLVKSLERKQTSKLTDEQEKQRKYGMEYSKLLKDLDPENSTVDEQVLTLMTDTKDLTYNQVIKGDPKEDFLINYRNAVNSVINKTKVIPRKTVIGDGKAAVGVNVPNTTVSKKVIDRSKLSPMEQQVARLLSDDDLAGIGI